MTDQNERIAGCSGQCQECHVEDAADKDPAWMSDAQMTFAEAEACYLHAKSRLNVAGRGGAAAALEYRAARAEVCRHLEILWPGASEDTAPSYGSAAPGDGSGLPYPLPRPLLCLLLGLRLLTAPASSQADLGARGRIGLALSGGSALGIAAVGILEWLDEHSVPIDCVALRQKDSRWAVLLSCFKLNLRRATGRPLSFILSLHSPRGCRIFVNASVISHKP